MKKSDVMRIYKITSDKKNKYVVLERRLYPECLFPWNRFKWAIVEGSITGSLEKAKETVEERWKKIDFYYKSKRVM